MLRFIFTLTVGILFSACLPNTLILNDIKKNPQALTTQIISRIAIPVRENGYSNINTQIIKSQQELDTFIKNIKLQSNWNQKKNFLETLLLKKINFMTDNLFLYRITMVSNLTVLSVEPPIGDKNDVIIKIDQEKPQIGTTDMGYYALAYKISKMVKTITLEKGREKIIIEN
jgi:hypothetical protein